MLSRLRPSLGADRSWWPAAAALVVAGWGANQFTPLAVVYRTELHRSEMHVVTMFTVYLFGLVPGLLGGSAVANRFGRRQVVQGALVASAVGSALLACTASVEAAGYVSRFLTGASTGLLISVGGRWLGELSPGHDERSVLAIGAGFAIGPLVAGAVAQWLPAPTVLPAALHALLALGALAATWLAPDTTPPSRPPRPPKRDRWQGVVHPRFVKVVLPASPAVFAASTVAYVVVPPLVVSHLGGLGVLFSGLCASITIGVGLLMQPLARWLDHEHSARSTLVAMTTVVVGLLLAAAAVDDRSVVLALATAVVLGAGYGLILSSGLAEIDRLAPEGAQSTAAAFYQGVAHSGFLTPLLLALLAGPTSYQTLLTILAVIGMVFLAITAAYSRKDLA